MKQFYCTCGQRVFFENLQCLACGRALGFDPMALVMVSGEVADGLLRTGQGAEYHRCQNSVRYDNCNWLCEAGLNVGLCLSCRLNEVIPALEREGNLALWARVEQAKRRLVYSLLQLGLPLEDEMGNALRFRIIEDQRRNPDVLESFVATAHQGGMITINIMEADDAARHALRQQMCERYRTVLGHLRHECGHFYFQRLVSQDLEECRQLFGDESREYESAINLYYSEGAPEDWPAHYVSAYASAHPAEDFAETFAHYLHITEALETARVAGLAREPGEGDRDWILAWLDLSVTLNEILRSLGGDDPYPFVLTDPVIRKLEFMNRIVRRPVARPAG